MNCNAAAQPREYYLIQMVSCELFRLAKVAGISAGVTLFTVNELGVIAKVEGNSMQPTFNPNCGQKNQYLKTLQTQGLSREVLKQEIKTRLQQDRVILNKWSARDKRELSIGDVVVLTSPRNPTKTLIKRIVAMPGDVIQIIETGEIKVIDEGHCWVEGDNQQSHSFDSNVFGQIPLGLIQGRVCLIIWPLHRIRKISCDANISLKSTRTDLISHKLQ